MIPPLGLRMPTWSRPRAASPEPDSAPLPPEVKESALRELFRAQAPELDLTPRWQIDAGTYGAEAAWTPTGVLILGGAPSYQHGAVSADRGYFFGKPPSVRADGGFYVSRVSSLVSFDADGQEQWSRKISGRESLSTATAVGPNGDAYVTDDSQLYAVKPEGEIRWQKPHRYAWVDHPPVVGRDGAIHMVTREGSVYALNPDGSFRWGFDGLVDSKAAFCPIYTHVVVGDDGRCFFSAGTTLYAVENGKLLWSRPLGSERVQAYDTPAVDRDGVVYAGCGQEVIAFDREGTELWRKELGAPLHLTALPEGGVAVGIRGGPIHGLDQHGFRRWRLAAGNTFAKPTFQDGEMLTATSSRHIMGVVLPTDPPRPDPPPGGAMGESPKLVIVGGVAVRKR